MPQTITTATATFIAKQVQTLYALAGRLLSNLDALLEDAVSQRNVLGAPHGQIRILAGPGSLSFATRATSSLSCAR